jgi:hypothetical protein
MMMTKFLMIIKCTLSASCFDGHGSRLVGYKVHRPMQHVQGYTTSHWTPPLGIYLLCITPMAARASANETTAKQITHFPGHFDGHGGGLVQYHAHLPMEEIQGFTRSHWTLALGEYCSQ